MVIRRSAVTPQDGLSPIKQTQSALAHDLDARAEIALDEAHQMPPGDARTEAIHKATVFRNAAEIHETSLRQARRTGRMTAALA